MIFCKNPIKGTSIQKTEDLLVFPAGTGCGWLSACGRHPPCPKHSTAERRRHVLSPYILRLCGWDPSSRQKFPDENQECPPPQMHTCRFRHFPLRRILLESPHSDIRDFSVELDVKQPGIGGHGIGEDGRLDETCRLIKIAVVKKLLGVQGPFRGVFRILG